MQRMLSGIKPSGQLTLGNYIGALKQFVTNQDEYEMFIFIANLHCITVLQDPKELKKNLKDCLGIYLACGLDPNKATIFLQSDVMQHAQLGWILQCHTYLGELNRMTQYKDKVAKKETNLSSGLYTYPALMAADILIYDADFVPVGEDQKQHVELARDICERFNNRYGETFKLPAPIIPKVGAKIMSLTDPTKKMSKSDHGDKGCIFLLDDLKVTRKKIMSAVTDSIGIVQFDPINQPGISNLLTIHSAISNESIADICLRFKDKGYGEFKKEVADVVCNELQMLQNRFNEIVKDDYLEQILEQGKQKATYYANKKLNKVQNKLGLNIIKK